MSEAQFWRLIEKTRAAVGILLKVPKRSIERFKELSSATESHMSEAEGDALLAQALRVPLRELNFEWKKETTFVRLHGECCHHFSCGG